MLGNTAYASLVGQAVELNQHYNLDPKQAAAHVTLHHETEDLLEDYLYQSQAVQLSATHWVESSDGDIQFLWLPEHSLPHDQPPEPIERPKKIRMSDKTLEKKMRQHAKMPPRYPLKRFLLNVPDSNETIRIDKDWDPNSNLRKQRLILRVENNVNSSDAETELSFYKAAVYTSVNNGPFILQDRYDELEAEILKDNIIAQNKFIYIPGGDKTIGLFKDNAFTGNDTALLNDLRKDVLDEDRARKYYGVPENFDENHARQWALQVRRAIDFEVQEAIRLGHGGLGKPISADSAELLLAKIRSAIIE